MEKTLTSDLGREYARALNARALGEIATWCEMAANALQNTDDEWADRAIYAEAATALRGLAKHAHRPR